MVKTVTILGSTGSIGQSTVKLLLANPDKFKVIALTANKNHELLAEQSRLLNPQFTATTEAEICEAASLKSDIVIAGIVGLAGLKPIMAAIKRGARIGLANKEAMVCAGKLMTDAAKAHNAEIIPVDSEHNAIFQIFDFANPKSVEKIILTASGGPFRNFSQEQLVNVTIEQATSHPNWKMGAKISVDSATMMNKGLELIEAYNLFPIIPEQLDVLIHPESIIHSFVTYHDGAFLAQAATPDMCVPISYVLNYPKRLPNDSARLDLAKIGSLNFSKPDPTKFPCFKLAHETLSKSQSYHIALNAANEVAVDKFLNKQIAFTKIAEIVETALNKHQEIKMNSLDDVFAVDAETRKTI